MTKTQQNHLNRLPFSLYLFYLLSFYSFHVLPVLYTSPGEYYRNILTGVNV